MIRIREVTGRLSGRTNAIFYVTVLGIAATGATQATGRWLGWSLPAAVAAVLAVELGGVALSIHADERRRLGETALAPRVLSALVAAGAVAVNIFGHLASIPAVPATPGHPAVPLVPGSPEQAAFFGGMSALGYCVWLIHSGARRRDQLRQSGQLDEVPPAYGIVQWCRHPWITRRARLLVLARNAERAAERARVGKDVPLSTPQLGRFASLAAAQADLRTERRTAAISRALRSRIKDAVDPTMAEIAIQTYDLDEVAARLAAGADYDGLTGILARELMPARITGEDQDQDSTGGDGLDDFDALADPVRAAALPAAPVSPGVPSDLRSIAERSKSAAVAWAVLALAPDVPHSRVVAYLAEHGVAVSDSLVRKVRRGANPTDLRVLVEATGEFPALTAVPSPAPLSRSSAA